MKYRVAIGTNDRLHITEHFGQCEDFLIADIDQDSDGITIIGERSTNVRAETGIHQDQVIREKIAWLKDCQIVLVKQIGGQSEKLLIHNGIIPLQQQGLIEDALKKIIKFYKNKNFQREG
jgi:predicted Fe-Mo cluster-binding NifX family protein